MDQERTRAAVRAEAGGATAAVRFGCHTISIVGCEGPLSVRGDRPLLHGLMSVRQTPVKVGCRGGGCGVCRIMVHDGHHRTLPMNRCRISAEEEAAGVRLACRVIPEGDMTIEPLPLRPGAAARH